jgi:hypothetical protein
MSDSGLSAIRCVFPAHVAVLVAASLPTIASAHEIVCARNAAGQLVAHVEVAQPVTLEESMFPGIVGFASPLGFASLEADEPEEGLLQLVASADVEAVLISADDGVLILDGDRLLLPGDAMAFGNPFFDYHPMFNVPDGHSGEEFTVRFQLRDKSGIYATSEEFSIVVTPAAVCHADFNADGFVDFFDIDAFVLAFEQFEHGADLNHDDSFDSVDLEEFAMAFESGC